MRRRPSPARGTGRPRSRARPTFAMASSNAARGMRSRASTSLASSPASTAPGSTPAPASWFMMTFATRPAVAGDTLVERVASARRRGPPRGRSRPRPRGDGSARRGARAARRAADRSSPAAARPGRGRARGSSGSRPPPPSSAAVSAGRSADRSGASPARPRRPPRRRAICRRSSASIPSGDEAERVHVLELGLRAEARLALAPAPRRSRRTGAMPFSISASEMPSSTTVWRRSCRKRLASSAERMLGCGDDLDERRAAAVEVDERRARHRGYARRRRRRGSSSRRPPRGARGRSRSRGRRRVRARRTLPSTQSGSSYWEIW